jgi:hypothetical protein
MISSSPVTVASTPMVTAGCGHILNNDVDKARNTAKGTAEKQRIIGISLSLIS